jgi:hypothetical protein
VQLFTLQLQQLFSTHAGQQLVTVSKRNAAMYANHGKCSQVTAGKVGSTPLTLPAHASAQGLLLCPLLHALLLVLVCSITAAPTYVV